MCSRYNEKADVHSFAVVTWELVTGWLPYAGLSPDQFMWQAVQVIAVVLAFVGRTGV